MNFCCDGGSVEIELMVQIQFKLPDLLNFKSPEDQSCCKHRFEQFCVTSGLVDESVKATPSYTLVSGHPARMKNLNPSL